MISVVRPIPRTNRDELDAAVVDAVRLIDDGGYVVVHDEHCRPRHEPCCQPMIIGPALKGVGR